MASMDDLPRLLQENEAIRNDFLETILGFMQRHNITVQAEDLKGVQVTGDVAGFIENPQAFIGAGLAKPTEIRRSVNLVYTTEGNSRSRTFWV